MKKTYIDPHDAPAIERATLRRTLAYLRPHGRIAAAVVGLIVIVSLLDLVPPLVTKALVDDAIPNADTRMLLVLVLAMVLAPLGADLLGMAQKLLTTILGERVMLDFRVAMLRHLTQESVGHIAGLRPGEAVSRVLNDVEGVGSVVQGTLFDIVGDVIVFSTTLFTLFVLDARLALVGMAVLPVFILPTRYVGRRRKALKRAAQAAKAELTGILTEILSVSGALLTRIYGAERLEVERFRGRAQHLVELSIRQTLLAQQYRVLIGLFKNLAPALVFGLGGYLVMNQRAELGTLVAFVALLKRLYGPASSLAGVQADVIVSYAYFERIFAVLDHEPDIASAPGAPRVSCVRGEIRFADVSFAYRAGVAVLDHVDLTIAPGQTVAVVGSSGAGKSTLAALVPRLVDPTGGAVLLDGRDLRALDLASLRQHMAVVSQETFLLNTTVLDNIRYGRRDATTAQVRAAARAAQIAHVIEALPNGYDTIVGDRGYQLSGGERQRVAIARAVLKDPRILILDEATSSLDAQSEALVQAALEPLLVGRTCLVIAHRLSTIQAADEIVVLDRGRIVERGGHADLLRGGGLYSRLYRHQLGLRSADSTPVAAN